MAGDKLPTIAHVAAPWLRPTETFIYDRVRFHERYRPVVLSTEPVENADVFPVDLFRSAAAGSFRARKSDAFARRVFGYSPFLARVAREEQAIALIAHFGPVAAASVPLSERLRLPLVAMFYGHDASAALRDLSSREPYARLFAHAAIVSVLSHDMRRRIVAAGCPDEKVRVHRLAFDTAVAQSAAPGGTGLLRIISNGRFVEKKGIHDLLDAFATVRKKHTDAELLLIGDGPLRAEIEARIARLNLSAAVRLAGSVPRTEVFNLLAGSHIFALPSVTAADGDMEGTPMALIEAAAAGLPAVTTAHAGNPEVVDDGDTGFVVLERDPAALADRLLALAAHPALRERMGAAAREKMRAEFDIHTVMRQIESDISALV
jgi:colanic acid/amylovoran biosynthesis glycosyltransferase